MNRVIVRYKVKPEHVEENVRLVEDVYAELEQTQPGGFHYSTHRLEDGLSFVHLAFIEPRPPVLTELESFKRFQSGLGERCDEPPVLSKMDLIGAYRFGGDTAR